MKYCCGSSNRKSLLEGSSYFCWYRNSNSTHATAAAAAAAADWKKEDTCSGMITPQQCCGDFAYIEEFHDLKHINVDR